MIFMDWNFQALHLWIPSGSRLTLVYLYYTRTCPTLIFLVSHSYVFPYKGASFTIYSLNHSAYHFFPGSYIDQQVSLYLIRSKEENKKTIMAEEQKKTMAEELVYRTGLAIVTESSEGRSKEENQKTLRAEEPVYRTGYAIVTESSKGNSSQKALNESSKVETPKDKYSWMFK